MVDSRRLLLRLTLFSLLLTSTFADDDDKDDSGGLQRDPKWAHLKDLHKALNLCKRALLWGSVASVQKLGPDQEVRIFEQPGSSICAAFIANNDTKSGQTINFRGHDYNLPARSISILPDCKTVVYNTQMITAQHNARNFVRSQTANKNFNWQMYQEFVPTQLGSMSKEAMELYGLTKDKTDYGWFTTTIELGSRDLPMKKDTLPVLRVASLGHGLLAFVNGEFVGAAHGSKVEKSFVFQKPVKFKSGTNQISLLGYLVGLPDSGAYMEHRYAGPRSITILGLNTGTLDLSINGWGHQAGLDGEKKQLFTEKGSKKVEWKAPSGGPALTWYKGYFDAPEGNNPVAIRMTGMGKGMVWINGESIGRYWMSYLSPLLQPTQSEYQIPRAFLKPNNNFIVILEEEGGDPKNVEILTVDRDTVCSYVTEYHPPSVRLFETKAGKLKPKSNDLRPKAELICPNKKQVVAVEFASFGDPFGACGTYDLGNCTSSVSKEVVEKYCMGKVSCAIPLDTPEFEKNDACPQMKKALAIQLKCAFKN
ncbi:hypothetical protein CCACVL1_16661 [Corchorus capsularis]|uniref:beta-galactosidase n=1 Tax=Corchorus capsularis TaxID=210143 RepID=A0A1R3HVW5_COCAP|nr:hypothetical protein CCACVL1_16661 [Corchorus capsularis]